MSAFLKILPAQCSVAEAGAPIRGAVASLSKGEHAIAASFTTQRLVEFASGRALAHQALRQLGVADDVASHVGRDNERRPVWPAGVTGSISHSSDTYVAAVAWTTNLLAVGIDIEPFEAMPPEACSYVFASDELVDLKECSRALAISGLAELVAFSAKESLFKVWSPITRTWLDHSEATVQVGVDGCLGFQIDPSRLSAPLRIQGAWTFDGRYVRTAAWLPATRPTASPDARRTQTLRGRLIP